MSNFYAGKQANQLLIEYLRASYPEVLYLYGGRSSGVSHLLIALCKRAEQQGRAAQYLPLADVIQAPAEMLQSLGQIDFLCLDDCQLLSESEAWQKEIFHLFNRIREVGGNLMFGSHLAPSELKLNLADLRSRMLSGESWAINALTDEDKAVALQTRAKARGFNLSDQVVSYLINRQQRDMSSLMDLLAKLDRLSLEQKKLITLPFVKGFL